MKNEDQLTDDQIGMLTTINTEAKLKHAYAVLKIVQKTIHSRALATFRIGETVEFNHKGLVRKGIVSAINQTRVSVQVGIMGWKVPGSMLRHVQPTEVK